MQAIIKLDGYLRSVRTIFEAYKVGFSYLLLTSSLKGLIRRTFETENFKTSVDLRGAGGVEKVSCQRFRVLATDD